MRGICARAIAKQRRGTRSSAPTAAGEPGLTNAPPPLPLPPPPPSPASPLAVSACVSPAAPTDAGAIADIARATPRGVRNALLPPEAEADKDDDDEENADDCCSDAEEDTREEEEMLDARAFAMCRSTNAPCVMEVKHVRNAPSFVRGVC